MTYAQSDNNISNFLGVWNRNDESYKISMIGDKIKVQHKFRNRSTSEPETYWASYNKNQLHWGKIVDVENVHAEGLYFYNNRIVTKKHYPDISDSFRVREERTHMVFRAYLKDGDLIITISGFTAYWNANGCLGYSEETSGTPSTFTNW